MVCRKDLPSRKAWSRRVERDGNNPGHTFADGQPIGSSGSDACTDSRPPRDDGPRREHFAWWCGVCFQ